MAGLTEWLMNPIGNLFNLFNTSNDGGSTLWNHGTNYANPSFTEQGNKNAGNFGLDPNGYVSGLWNDVMGFTSQSREFAQQEFLQDKMNKYNLPANQLKRLMDAGINPNVAASAIAGSGSESAQAPQVASNTAGVAEGIGKVAGAVASLGAGAASFADAAFKEGTLSETIANISADTKKKLSELGLNEAQIRGLNIDNMYKDSEWQKKLAILDLEAEDYSHQWELMDAEWSLKMQKINESLKQMELMDSEIGVNTANADYLDMLRQKTELEKEWMNIRIEFWKARGFDILSSSRDLAIVQMIENGKDIKPLLSSLRDYEESIAYASGKGEQKAIRDYAQSIAFRRNKGEAIASTRYSSAKGFSEAFWKVVQSYDNTLNEELFSIYKRFKAHPSDGKQLRRNLSAALGELTSDNVMMDDPDVRDLINEITDLLQFSDSALVQYFKNLENLDK